MEPAAPGPHGHRAPHASTSSRLRGVTLAGPAGVLEGLLQERETHDHTIAAVVCHPHPLHGGTLHNKVVHRIASVLHEIGAAVLRFNFRGVAGSAGVFDHGAGELDDARAALRWMEARHSGARLWVAGFSFGSWVAARLAASEPRVERVILVAPPVASLDFSTMRSATVPKLVFQGTQDEVTPLATLEAAVPGWAAPKTLVKIEGASHFFDRRLAALGDAMRGELTLRSVQGA